MTTRTMRLTLGAALALCAAWACVFYLSKTAHAQAGAPRIAIDADDIAGTVTSSKGPEAGVWVIAETKDLPTGFFKMVVTDDQGRFVVPDLPRAASYQVWARGYGLVDGAPVTARPGQQLALRATVAPTAREAAEYYPASWWFSLLKVPAANEFPGTGPSGNGISSTIKNQANWLGTFKTGCIQCHQLGNKATRMIPPQFGSGAAGWARRIQAGQRGPVMVATITGIGHDGAMKVLGDWTDRIAAGEFPQEAPPRPTGIERNFVVERWDWRGPNGTIHDSVSTDKRNPRVNASGKIFGIDLLNGVLGWVDPLENRTGDIKIPVSDPETPPFAAQRVTVPSAYVGDKLIWNSSANGHNPMMDGQGRVWMTSSSRPPGKQPAFCTDPNNKFAKNFPIRRSGRQASYYDPKTDTVTPVDTCFGTHHLQFAEDRDNTLYFSQGADTIGWINTAVWDRTKNLEQSQGWCSIVLDTNGDGKIGEHTMAGQPRDPAKDLQIEVDPYGIIISPKDNSIWGADPGPFPGRIVRLDVGSNPPETCKGEVYIVPFDLGASSVTNFGFTPRGIDVDRNGVVWTALSGTAALASFDRTKCKVLNGPTATGDHCREGWTVYETPSGPKQQGANFPGNAGFHYYNWVDQFDTLGLGRNVPVVTGSNDDAMHMLVNGRWVTLRVPYPMGAFYTKGVDGRIDDPNGGWKGRSWHASTNLSLAWHQEGGYGRTGGAYQIQLRPNPLAH